MPQPLPPPPIEPFERLQVMDGLLVNAERWRLAHDYHRQRQSFHYQALHQPGIVCGLGVRAVPAPREVSAKFRDGRWVQIQPGIAIDLAGNPIVIAQPIEFRISSELLPDRPLLVYLAVSYVDPDNLRRRKTGETVQETFRIDEKLTPPDAMEVEVCRVLLRPGVSQLINPTDVFFPGTNAIDLRYRVQAQARPRAVVRVAQVVSAVASRLPAEEEALQESLTYLLQSVSSLYPELQAVETVEPIGLSALAAKEGLPECDLLCVTMSQLRSLEVVAADSLRSHLVAGGAILVETSIAGTNIGELRGVQQELMREIHRLDAIASTADATRQSRETRELTAAQKDLIAELEAVEDSLSATTRSLCLPLKTLASRLGISYEALVEPERDHPLRLSPFLFAALPAIEEQPVQILTAGGIVVVIGPLSGGWGLDAKLARSRETIRTAQEMGINLLHFAWQRRKMTQGLQAGKG